MLYLLKVTGKIFDLLKSKSYLGRLKNIVPGFVKTFWAAAFLQTSLWNYKSITKLGTNRLWLEITHAMDMVSPCKPKELFPKVAVPKRQKKSLKTTCELVTFYYICKLYTWNFLKIIFSPGFFRILIKLLVISLCMK